MKTDILANRLVTLLESGSTGVTLDTDGITVESGCVCGVAGAELRVDVRNGVPKNLRPIIDLWLGGAWSDAATKANTPDVCVGLWVDAGFAYFDLSVLFDGPTAHKDAKAFARANNQLAFFDLDACDTVHLD